MTRRIAVCFAVALVAVFGTTACAGGEGQEEVEALEGRVAVLEEQVDELQILVGAELAEEPQQEQTQQEPTQQEKTQERTQQEKTQ